MSACLVLVRHAQSCFDTDDYDRLSPAGEQQAARLAEWWLAHRAVPGRIVTGPLQRQRATAGFLARVLQPRETMVESGLGEFDHRAIFHAHRPDLRDPAALAAWKQEAPDYQRRFERTWQAALQRWQDPSHAADYPEPWPAFRGRCVAALEALLARLRPGETMLAVTSAGVLAVALQQWSQHEVPPFATLQGSFANTGFTELLRPGPTEVKPVLGQVDATLHLAPAERTWR